MSRCKQKKSFARPWFMLATFVYIFKFQCKVEEHDGPVHRYSMCCVQRQTVLPPDMY